MIILWTDALIFLLCGFIIGLSFYLRDKATMQRPLKTLASNQVSMVALTVLLFFVAIGLVDSVHFKNSADKNNEVISVLDYIATPLREHTEKTYSAPFATTLYSKEMTLFADGAMHWTYPRLMFGGQHLIDDSQLIADVLIKTGQALLAGLMVFILCTALSYYRLKIKKCRYYQYCAAPCILTLGILLLLSFSLSYLSLYYHVFGTDKVGEDVFYQAIKSIRTGLVIGTLTTLVMLPLAIFFGILAGFFRGVVDDVIQYIYTTLNAIPSVLLIAASILMVQVYMSNHEDDFTSVLIRADTRLLFLCLILGVTSWTGLCRLLRAETLKLREMDYVQAAYALGVKQPIILMRHILPNVMHLVICSVVLDFSSLVLAEAVLSYINIGVDASSYSWGNMINGARLEVAREPIVWWSLLSAFIFMFALVLAANLFADGVQNAFDPRRANERL